jgi:hypothetical protein
MAWTETSENTRNNYVRATESLTVPDPGAAVESSVNSTNLGCDVSGSKFVAGAVVTDANGSTDGALNFRIQASLDNTNWVTADTMSLDIDNDTATNSSYGEADLSAWYAPYWRIQVFSDGTDLNGAPVVTVSYAAMDLSNRVHPIG